MKSAPAKVMVITEGADIYCERQGSGPLLLLIHGAMEDAGFYSSAADILAEKFTVVSYDRRCNSRSSGDRSAEMTVAPDNVSMAAVALAISGGGALSSFETTVLLTVDETMDALRKAGQVQYRAPGA